MQIKKYTHVIGIDVSKNWLDISLNGKVTRIDQTKSAITRFIKKITLSDESTLVVMESTGGYERLATDNFKDAGLTVHIAHPNRIRAYAKARGCLAKTDKLDAKIIESYGRFVDPSRIHGLPSKKERLMCSWSRHLSHLKASLHQQKCRIELVDDIHIKRSINKLIRIMTKEIEQIEKRLLHLVQSDETLKRKYKILCSMKGVGPTLAMILLAELPELGRATKKEIAALVGVAPMTSESGMRARKAQTHYGRQSVRRVLYMGALVGAHHNKRLKVFYQRLLAKGKEKKVALVAVMRKMIVILNAMLQKNTLFNA